VVICVVFRRLERPLLAHAVASDTLTGEIDRNDLVIEHLDTFPTVEIVR
jgi:hypothetical protein